MPDADGRYDERAVVDAVRARGWDVRFDGTNGDWVVEVSEELADEEFRAVLGGDADRMTALLEALDIALEWPDEDEARRILDAEAPISLGISGDEFRRRWREGELLGPLMDPHAADHEAVRRLHEYVIADRSGGR